MGNHAKNSWVRTADHEMKKVPLCIEFTKNNFPIEEENEIFINDALEFIGNGMIISQIRIEGKLWTNDRKSNKMKK